MNLPRPTPALWLTLSLAGVLLVLGWFSSPDNNLLELDRLRIAEGEWWRLLSGNLVHYGFYHLLMNLAALLVCGYVFFLRCNLWLYGGLLLFSGLCVGLGVYWGTPEFMVYRGLSGVLHGLIIFGFLFSFKQTPWINGIGLILVVGKLIHEQNAAYQATDLQQLLPVPVVVDAHLYGAISGVLFMMGYAAAHFYRRHFNR
ncbi:MAG TPA: rhombosortase [Cellvibrio sp.]|nr:rhombosortase [Cellvibrio sp.]